MISSASTLHFVSSQLDKNIMQWINYVSRVKQRIGYKKNLQVYFYKCILKYHIQIVSIVRKSYKRQLVSHEGFGDRKGFHISLVILNVIKITAIYITAKLRNNRSSSYEKERKDQLHSKIQPLAIHRYLYNVKKTVL